MVAQSAIAIALKLQWCLYIIGIALLAQELAAFAVQSHQEEVCVVLMGCLSSSFWWGRYSKEQTQSAIEALETVGLSDFIHRSFADLSGGQKQRALIARAVMSQPDLLLLDEPTASVDIHGTEHFYKMFAEMNKKFTILIVSHDIGFVSSHVKSVICVRKNLQIHPVSELTGESLQKMYGLDVHLIRHDHRCSEKGHTCPHS